MWTAHMYSMDRDALLVFICTCMYLRTEKFSTEHTSVGLHAGFTSEQLLYVSLPTLQSLLYVPNPQTREKQSLENTIEVIKTVGAKLTATTTYTTIQTDPAPKILTISSYATCASPFNHIS